MSSASQKTILARIEELASTILIKQEKIQTLQAEVQILREERNRLTHHLDSVNTVGVESINKRALTNHGSILVNGVQSKKRRRMSSGIKPGSIKAAVVDVLSRHPTGLIALDILRHINAERDVPLERTSLSPQLSRLQRDGLIENDEGVWKIVSK